MSTANMNIQPSKKYGLSPDEIERKASNSERFRAVFNMHRFEKTQKLNARLDRYNKKKYLRKRKKTKGRSSCWRKSVRFGRKNKEEKCPWKIL